MSPGDIFIQWGVGERMNLTPDTFCYWVNVGNKFAQLASGGTIHILCLIAGLNLRSFVGRASWDHIQAFANVLRRPNDLRMLNC
jgi:hypothetical protein